jgi:hypothetical protein
VRRLRLTAASDEDARSAATLLSDALGTMSLPGANDGRLVVIRQIALGRISLRSSAATVALQIEHAARQVWSEAVCYDLPSAAAAHVVVFPDRARPIMALARLHARAAPSHDWFWRAAVPGWRPDLTADEGWRVLLDAAHHLPAPVLVAAAVVDAAADAGVADVLLAGIRRSEAAAWLRMYGWTDGAPAAEMVAARLQRPAAIEGAVRTWGAEDDRVIWLGALLCTHATPALAANPRLPGRVARALGELATSRRPRLVEQHDRAPAAPTPSIDASPRLDTPDAALRDRTPAALSDERRSQFLETLADPESGGEPTSHAGLLFVLPILERLGFDAFLRAHPALLATEFPACLLRAIGERLAIPAQDPLAVALMADRTEDETRSVAPLDAPALAHGLALAESLRSLLSSPPPRAPMSSPLDAWLIAVRRWSRRQARLGLATLVCRPGLVRVSPTHLDVSFDLSQTDLRIRRLALDVDPGWVPWLGRVVQFHYVGRHSTR